MSGFWGPQKVRDLGLELVAGPAGCFLCCLQVHRVLHELRGDAGLSEGSKEEEVSMGYYSEPLGVGVGGECLGGKSSERHSL